MSAQRGVTFPETVDNLTHEGKGMKNLNFRTWAAALVIGLSMSCQANAQSAAVTIGDTDIGGVVSGAKGPEAGVWVVAETTDLPTRFARIVVTDERGRYLIPDLPKANYSVWVRGYGLVDSPKMRAVPGRLLNHTAVAAPNDTAAAQYYPAIYWPGCAACSPDRRRRS
jgi:hypothetical protein